MTEPLEARSIIDAAEQSAAAGDYAAAEKLLREAAGLQEARLGPLHPDLANTLNNLGVVCEANDNPVDAEHCFRRAFAIATTVLKPDHPFVATSRQNLRDFCEARGKQIELPTVEPEVTTTLEAQATSSADPSPETQVHADPSPETQVHADPSPETQVHADPPPETQVHADPQDVQLVSRTTFSRLAIGVLGPLAMLIVILVASLPLLSSADRAESSSAIAVDSQRDVAPPPAPVSVASPPAPPMSVAAPPAHVSVEPTPVPDKTTTTTGSGPDAAIAGRTTPASTVARPIVVKARLCAELDGWLCDPADRPVPPGPLYFYTQLKSTRATTVQHRWYWNNHLNQSLELRVEGNPTAGYRTYSRNTMKRDSAGDWRVELRSEDGALLYEERFTVR